jgi:hypothetical protein
MGNSPSEQKASRTSIQNEVSSNITTRITTLNQNITNTIRIYSISTSTTTSYY